MSVKRHILTFSKTLFFFSMPHGTRRFGYILRRFSVLMVMQYFAKLLVQIIVHIVRSEEVRGIQSLLVVHLKPCVKSLKRNHLSMF